MTSRIPLPRWLPCATQTKKLQKTFAKGRLSVWPHADPKRQRERVDSQMFVNDSDHHSVTLRNFNLEAAEVFFVLITEVYWTTFPKTNIRSLVSGRLTFIKEATFRSNILRMGCLRFRGQATAVDVGKILQERFLQSWGSGPVRWNFDQKTGGLVVQPWHLCTDTLLMCMHVTFWQEDTKYKN